jgi:hypothetical protein
MSVAARLSVVPTSDLRAWRDGVESLNPAKSPCPGLHGEAWQKTHAVMLDFLDRFGEQAQDLGWTDLDLFGVHPTIGAGRVDHCGALTLGPKDAQAIDADRIHFGNTTFYRTVMGYLRPRGVPIWAFKG